MLIRTSNLNFSGEFNQIKDVKLLTGVDWLMTKNSIPWIAAYREIKNQRHFFRRWY
jgi:hypothetical protein